MPNQAVQVYIVDSEPSVCVAYARLLRSAKMHSRIFNSVEEFMRTDVSDENSCVIAEVTMPSGRGIELPSLLAHGGHRLPVIFITADDTEEIRCLAQKVGAAAFFRKPIDGEALLDAITWAVAKSRDG